MKRLRGLGMVVLVLVCFAVALVVNLGPPQWLRDVWEDPAPVAAPETAGPVLGPGDLVDAETPEGMHLTWREEFTGRRGAKPDPARWNIETTTPDTGELERNTRKNVALDGKGRLVITARSGAQGYTSARITTEGKFAPTYGRVTVRMKSPDGKGLWPAFWLLGADHMTNPWPASGEIDVMERRGDLTDRYYSTVQGPGYSGVGISKQYAPGRKVAFSSRFHVFGVDWTPTALTFMIDGKAVHTVDKASVPGEWVFDHPFFLVLNLAVGGPFPGEPTEATPFPAKMVVDYIRAYSFDIDPAT
ncbi:glycosyl hydrolase family 16 [Actinocorallia herbida]|uniref:Glycosyl hydrolase family 16 n=1 Tax=Actinocorallia herbida TaxID=58109 RepID=A0A3N1D7W5_9ACTN|nr:glycoside hydrolase family 16 protein [Actinocorallia herbida]ROO89622.1 glycosyl hydrolase family 16 [Actinocorallia herbida]